MIEASAVTREGSETKQPRIRRWLPALPEVERARRAAHARRLGIVLVAAWAARAAFIAAFPDAQSTDVRSWETVAHLLREGHNPYVSTNLLGWPPLWMILVFVLSHIASACGISFLLALRLFLIAVESALIIVLYTTISTRFRDPDSAFWVTLVGISLNPIAILLVCQHGNFDVLVALLMFWAALELASYGKGLDPANWLTSSFAIGLAALAKTVPIALVPLLAYGARRSSRRFRMVSAVLVLGPISLGLAVLFALAPSSIIHHVLLYQSTSGAFGVSGVLDAANMHGLAHAWARASSLFLIAWLFIGSRWLAREPLDLSRILLLVGLIMLAVPTFGPGYATQYIYWWMPFLAATYTLFDREWRQLLSGLYVIAAFTYVIEYATEKTYGAFLDPSLGSAPWFQQLSQELQTPLWQTIERLPLFAVSVLVFYGGIQRVRGKRQHRSSAYASAPIMPASDELAGLSSSWPSQNPA